MIYEEKGQDLAKQTENRFLVLAAQLLVFSMRDTQSCQCSPLSHNL